MDTQKIDTAVRELALVPFFLFAILQMGLYAASVTIDTSAVTLDGLLPTYVAFFGILLVRYQIRQTSHQIQQSNIQIEQRSREMLLEKFRGFVIAASNNILHSRIRDGYMFFDSASDRPVRCIFCWHHNHHRDTDTHHFNMLFRIMEDYEDIEAVLAQLRDASNLNRWSFRVLIPLFGKTYGIMSQASAFGYGIEKMDQYGHDCILYSVSSVQLFDHDQMSACQRNMSALSLRNTNNNYLENNNIFATLQIMQ